MPDATALRQPAGLGHGRAGGAAGGALRLAAELRGQALPAPSRKKPSTEKAPYEDYRFELACLKCKATIEERGGQLIENPRVICLPCGADSGFRKNEADGTRFDELLEKLREIRPS